MDEITLLTAIRPAAPERFGDPERGQALGRLLAAAAAEPAAGPSLPARPARQSPIRSLARPPRWPAGRRPGARWLAAGAAVTLAAAAGILIAVPLTGAGPSRPAVRPPAVRSQGQPATAAAVLLLAAHAAATAPGLTARPDQFVYTEQLIRGEIYAEGMANGQTRVVHVPPYLYRTWMSADGRRGIASSQRTLPGGAWSRPGGAESLCPSVQDPAARETCFSGYLKNLPRTVAGMLSYLLRSDGPNGPAAYKVLGSIVGTSSASGLLVPNQSYALMYRAAATVRGIELVPHTANIAGTAGIGVAACVPADIDKGSMPGFHGCPERTELIFDARTYELIGVNHVAAPGQRVIAGQPSIALLGIAVVNKIGQLP
jgi:hypothetical protein